MIKYNTKTFVDVWNNVNAFVVDYNNNGVKTTISEDDVRTLYYLLYARYGNNPIANNDVNQFRYKVYSIIYQFGPTWVKRLEIQERLRNLSDEELLIGSKAIYNRAFNPDERPSTKALEELDRINEQNTTNYKKSKMEAYATLWEALRTDVSTYFLDKFAVCFKQFVINERPFLYVEEEED